MEDIKLAMLFFFGCVVIFAFKTSETILKQEQRIEHLEKQLKPLQLTP